MAGLNAVLIPLAGVLALVASQVGSDPVLTVQRSDPFQVQSQSPSARLPVGPTIPSAIYNDLLYHGATIDSAIQTIKNLSPRFDVVPVIDIPKSVPIDDQSVPIQVGCISPQQFGWA